MEESILKYGGKMPIIAGVEEAGRGPVIGPMVMAISVIDAKEEPKLKELGVKDSKKLSPRRRYAIFEQLKSLLNIYNYVIIPPDEIDDALYKQGNNLNRLEADKTIELIQSIQQSLKIDEIYIDCPSTNTKAYSSYLFKRLNINPSCIIAEHKADENYPIVSAASIIAKVIRDKQIQELHEQYEVDFGSGYTSDERTITFLRDWVIRKKELPTIARKSWSTAKSILNEVVQAKLEDFFKD